MKNTASKYYFPHPLQSFSHCNKKIILANSFNYYDELGIHRDADLSLIKSAYRQLVRKFHPDVNKESNANKKFKRITEAYETLSDSKKKTTYDQLINVAPSSFGRFSTRDPFSSFEHFFTSPDRFFSEQKTKDFEQYPSTINWPTPGEDEKIDISITFIDAVFGCYKEITIKQLTNCRNCHGSGALPVYKEIKCYVCGGNGNVVNLIRTPLGILKSTSPCRDCQGHGNLRNPCSRCEASGKISKTKLIKIKVPAGVKNGSRLLIKRDANIRKTSVQSKDIIVCISVKNDKLLQRDGANIRSTISIPYYEAILGTLLEVLTVDGKLDFNIPPNTQPNTTFCLNHRGSPQIGFAKNRGHHLLKVRFIVPKKMRKEQRLFIEEIKILSNKINKKNP